MLCKTWVEINQKAAKHNFHFFKQLLNKKTKLWAVVKSNAYGHGLVNFSLLAERLGVDGFCVDSVLEGKALRQSGIKRPILVLGPTLPDLFPQATENQITVTASSPEALKQILTVKNPPFCHLKIDSGMHRQGIYLGDLLFLIKKFKSKLKATNCLRGVYTHFASAKDINYPTYTEKQFTEFLKAVQLLSKAGFPKLIKHAAATGATLISKKYHLDTVRIGIGLYGLWPSLELEIQLSPAVKLQPVLSWKAIISEIKPFKRGDYFGYDLIAKAFQNGRLAIIPIGYWHGLDRKLSGCGAVLVNKKRAPILGRVSMDILIIDITGISCQPGEEAIIIGRQGQKAIKAEDLARQINTSHYEIITRINPLIKRINV